MMTIKHLDETLTTDALSKLSASAKRTVFSTGVPGFLVELTGTVEINGQSVPVRGVASLSIPGAKSLADPDGFVAAHKRDPKAKGGKAPAWASAASAESAESAE